jgi:hypothetical protein
MGIGLADCGRRRAGIAASSWDYGYDQCVFWNGFAWVNACDQPYGDWW